jgi:acylphosphatase
VQGVGFRPMVYQLANEMQLNGYVKNDSTGVYIVFNTSQENANAFFKKIIHSAPLGSTIISASLQHITDKAFNDFSIVVEMIKVRTKRCWFRRIPLFVTPAGTNCTIKTIVVISILLIPARNAGRDIL